MTSQICTAAGCNLEKVARTTGLGIRRKSIRISFDTFMAKSRPGLETGEEEVQGQGEKENISLEQLTEKRKEKQFSNVRRRNNSWSEKQKVNSAKKTALRTKSLTLNSS